ncbi:hypothetical protein AF72_04125 [Xylella taiwanensis]|uniref:Uncharacterized protein n=1 Tax=Xylella taiwanensis TaxID=1444770 RepID=Z9JKP9_9GAMM|nr:hypothetical protein AF72_04125 [Xylella taiwanensis]
MHPAAADVPLTEDKAQHVLGKTHNSQTKHTV